MNRHRVYPRSTDGTVHREAYVAATFDGQLSVPTLCGAQTFYVVTDGTEPDCEACTDTLMWGPHVEVSPPRPRCPGCGYRRALIEGVCGSCRAQGVIPASLFPHEGTLT